jgi:hypothetical protein
MVLEDTKFDELENIDTMVLSAAEEKLALFTLIL